MKKKIPIRTFLNHPAATPETEVFFSMALGHFKGFTVVTRIQNNRMKSLYTTWSWDVT